MQSERNRAKNFGRVDGEFNGRYSNGMAGTKIYQIWADMVARCSRPTHQRYNDYGGRGITVCDRWRSFPNFYADMGDRPDGCSLDRRENDLGYSPSNCRWATASEQRNNSRAVPKLQAFGVHAGLTELARIYGLTRGQLRARVRKLENVEDAIASLVGPVLAAGWEYR